MEHIVTEEKIHEVSTRFELAVGRMIERWLAAGRVELSSTDVRLVREFLEHSGCKVEDLPSGSLRVSRRGRGEEMTREAMVVEALRRLANRTE